MADSVGARAHLNPVESSRQLYELDRGAQIEVGAGWQFGAGTPDHPAIANAAFRADDGLDPAEFLARALEFFGGRGRRFVIWARAGAAADEDLLEAAGEAGFQNVHTTMPAMTLPGRAAEPRLADGDELRFDFSPRPSGVKCQNAVVAPMDR